MKLSLLGKIFAFVISACVLCLGVTIFVSSYQAEQSGMEFLENQSSSLIGNYEAARSFIATQGLLDKTIKDMVDKYPDGKLTKEDKKLVLQQVPIFAALSISRADKNDNYTVKVVAEDARNKDSEATSVEKIYLKKFENNPSLTHLTHHDENSGSYWYMKPIRLSKEQGCLNCHGHPSTSPWGNGKDILGYEMEDWKDGQVHGMFKVESKLAPIVAQTKETRNSVIMYGGVAGIAVLAIVFLALRSPIGRIARFAEELTESSERNKGLGERMKKNAQTIASGAQEQSSALAQTVSSTTQISTMVERNTEASRQMADIAKKTAQISNEGMQEINSLVHAFDEIRHGSHDLVTQMNDNARQIDEIGSLIKQIEDKTSVINDIVFQTKLLAFNASVEAARAGEAGKGFAVVAEEVGSLATKSGASAKEIGEILDASASRVAEIVEGMKSRMDSSVKSNEQKIQQGTAVVERCQQTFKSIGEQVELVSRRTQEILNASEEQNLGLGEIKQAVDSLEKLSHDFNEVVREGLSAADELGKEAVELTRDAVLLSTLVRGGNEA